MRNKLLNYMLALIIMLIIQAVGVWLIQMIQIPKDFTKIVKDLIYCYSYLIIFLFSLLVAIRITEYGK